MKQPISVLRDARLGDCTNGGVSSTHDSLMAITADELPLPEDFRSAYPLVVLEQHVRGCLRLVPLAHKEAGHWSMMGGNFGYTSDGRFSEACEQLLGHRFYGAVAIHDRVEA